MLKFRCSNEQTFTNLVLSNESLASTYAKLISMNLANWIPAENVYTSVKCGKAVTMEAIVNRFKKNLVIISRNPETHELAKRVTIFQELRQNFSPETRLIFSSKILIKRLPKFSL